MTSTRAGCTAGVTVSADVAGVEAATTAGGAGALVVDGATTAAGAVVDGRGIDVVVVVVAGPEADFMNTTVIHSLFSDARTAPMPT